MPMMASEIPMLTDDELVAVSVRLAAPWRTVLPTVDLTSEERVLAAIMTGSRSLYVRGLLDPDSDVLDDALLTHLRGIGERRVVLAAYAAGPDGGPLDGAASQYFFGCVGDDQWQCDAVSAGGVHTFGADMPTAVEADAVRAVRDVLAGGVQGYDVPASLMLISEGEHALRQLEVGRDTLVARTLVAGEATPQDVSAVPELAVAWLLGR